MCQLLVLGHPSHRSPQLKQLNITLDPKTMANRYFKSVNCTSAKLT
jgi:hypothetical protein